MTGPAPLRKKKLEGGLYTRRPVIEAKLGELIALPHGEIMTRCAADDEADPKYIPSECLMYLVRSNRENAPGIYFETVYTLLLQRVMEQLPPEVDSNLTNSEIRSEALGAFAELLAADRMNYDEGIDYYEICFKDAVAKLRKNAARKPDRLKNRSRPLEPHSDDPDGGEFSPEIEKAGGCMDFDKYFGSHDRSRLAEAISTLPEQQIAILEMLKNEIPIDSEDPEIFTISKALAGQQSSLFERSQFGELLYPPSIGKDGRRQALYTALFMTLCITTKSARHSKFQWLAGHLVRDHSPARLDAKIRSATAIAVLRQGGYLAI